MVDTVGLLDPAVAALSVGIVVVLLGLLRYGYDLPVRFGVLVVPPVVGLTIAVAVLLKLQFGLHLVDTLGVTGGGLLVVATGYLAAPYAGRAAAILCAGGRQAAALVLTVVMPWRLTYWLRAQFSRSG